MLVALALVSLGVVRLVAWLGANRLRRLDADYRAFVMLAQARYDMHRAIELDRAVSALEAQWEAQEPCPTTVAAELRAERLNDATLCESEWAHGC
ncbi:hypothetical protein ACM9XD_16595 [Xanthomonas sacchari]